MPSESSTLSTQPVLILGGGIHGAAVARELILNGVPVVLVDTNDLATGATSKSSRLIHGGLRYLEYGDVGLVRESLIERRRLLQLAPHLVQPLRLYVPTSQRWSGLIRSGLGFFKLARTRIGRWMLSRSERRAPRGFWPIRIGLWMYDLFSWGDGLPSSAAKRVPTSVLKNSSSITSRTRPPQVDPNRYRWLCEYSDAQMRYPERCVFELLADAQQEALTRGISFEVLPHARLTWNERGIRIDAVAAQAAPVHGNDVIETNATGTPACWSSTDVAPRIVHPLVIVNASGAWGDLTLKGIDAGTTPLFAGTKGSHFVTRHVALKAALGESGVYAETGDRRLAFILPFGNAVLVGTTDEVWSGPPEAAVASEEELEYLLSLVHTVFGLALNRSDIESHYSGVRPLPRTMDTSNSAVTRDHSLAEHRLHGILILTLVGGKLTTFRSVAEQISSRVLKRLDIPRQISTRDRALPGARDFPSDPTQSESLWEKWAADFCTTLDEIRALWPLYGMRTRHILSDVAGDPPGTISDISLQRRTVRWVIRHEWVTTLEDLVERRLLLIFAPRLTEATLQGLAECLVECGRLPHDQVGSEVNGTRERLATHYGRSVG